MFIMRGDLTSPIFYQGSAYGYSCVKKVHALYRKSKTKIVIADKFETEKHENGTLIRAFFEGKKYIDHIMNYKGYSTDIIILENTAYINLFHYKKYHKK